MIISAMRNAIKEASFNNNDDAMSFDPIEEGLIFMYESERASNAITEALNTRTISSLQETGSIQPLNEEEKESFFTKVTNLLKQFWAWVCKVWDKIYRFITGLFKSDKKNENEAAKEGANIYLNGEAASNSNQDAKKDEKETATTTSTDTKKSSDDSGSTKKTCIRFSYNNHLSFVEPMSTVQSKIGDLLLSDENSELNGSEVLNKATKGLAPGITAANGNTVDINKLKSELDTYLKGKEIDIYETYANDFLKGSIDANSKIIQDKTNQLKNTRDAFQKYTDTTIRNMENMKTQAGKDGDTSAVQMANDIKNFVQRANSIFSTAWSCQAKATQEFVKNIKDAKDYFVSIGYKKGQLNESSEYVQESEKPTATNETTMEKISDSFLNNLSII